MAPGEGGDVPRQTECTAAISGPRWVMQREEMHEKEPIQSAICCGAGTGKDSREKPP